MVYLLVTDHGSTGNSQDPEEYGREKRWLANMEMLIKLSESTIIGINDIDELLYVKGSVPGPKKVI